MDSMIREIYQKVIQETEALKGVEAQLEAEIRKIIPTENGNVPEYEEIRDTYFRIMFHAEEEGFVAGFKMAARLLAECMYEGGLMERFYDF